LKAQVWSVELIQPLADKAKKILSQLGYNVAIRNGDGSHGWRHYAPYNAIIVTAGASFLPQDLLEQLDTGGKLIIPIGPGDKQQLTIYTKMAKQVIKQVLDEFQFVPLLSK
jgi:protein-L-isoaspartate(D-aspartate) O-methyltransferase